MFGPSKTLLQDQINWLNARVQDLERAEVENIKLRAEVANLRTWINLDMGLRGLEPRWVPEVPQQIIPAVAAHWELRKAEKPQVRDDNGRFAKK